MPPLFPSSAVAKIGLFPKLAYTAFVAVLVTFYLKTYGPTNFLYFCDAALLLGLLAMWTESALLASMPAVGIIVVQFVWLVDFVLGLFGHDFGLASYMFNPHLSLFARILSLFHGWLPFVLLWLVHRLGYDRRAMVSWTVLAWSLLLISYFLMPAPPAPSDNPNLPVNINLVFGPSDAGPQTWMSPDAWFLSVTGGLTLVFFLTDRALRRFMPAVRAKT